MKKAVIPVLAVMAIWSCQENASDATGVFDGPSVTVSAETQGKILEIDVEEGDVVQPGDCMLLIDTVQLALQLKLLESRKRTAAMAMTDVKTQTESLRMQLDYMRIEQSRVARLVAAGAATQQQKEQIDNNILSLEWQIKALEENIAIANESNSGNIESLDIQIESVRDMIGRCHVNSPTAGTVTALYVGKGETVAQGMPLVRLVDMDRIFLRAYFEGRRMADVKLGGKVRVRTMFGGNEREYEGRIVWISSESEFTPKSVMTSDDRSNLVYAVKISVENDGFLKAGMYGEVWLE